MDGPSDVEDGFAKLNSHEVTHELSPLERLPTDLFREILEYEPLAIFDLRLTSRRLKKLVDEVALDRSVSPFLPMVEMISFFSVEENLTKKQKKQGRVPAKLLAIVIDVVWYMRRWFTVRLKARKNFTIRRMGIDGCTFILNMNLQTVGDSLLEALGEALGTKIGEVRNVFTEGQEFAAVWKVLDGIEFERFRVDVDSRSEESTAHLLATVRERKVQHLDLQIDLNHHPDPAKLLLEISTLVNKIRIRHDRNDESERDYFIGIEPSEITSTIIEMYSRKLKNLDILDVERGYLTKECVDEIIEKLPFIGKRILFKTTCFASEDGLFRVINDYFAQVHDRTLRIGPKSRKGNYIDEDV